MDAGETPEQALTREFSEVECMSGVHASMVDKSIHSCRRLATVA